MQTTKASPGDQAESEVDATSSFSIVDSKIDLIYISRIYTITAMLLAALLLYVILNKHIENALLELWIVLVLLVDAYRLFTSLVYYKRKKSGRFDNTKARQSLLISSVLSGLSWGYAGLLLLPLADSQGKILIILTLMGVASIAVVTAFHLYMHSVIFILLVMLSVILGVIVSADEVGIDSTILVTLLCIYSVILLSVTMTLYRNISHMLMYRAKPVTLGSEKSLPRDDTQRASNAISSIYAKMSHELRTPIHAILGFSDIGINKLSTATPDKLSSYFIRINESGKRLLKLLDYLYDLTKYESDQMVYEFKEQSLQSTVETVLEKLNSLADDKHKKVTIIPMTQDLIALYDNEKIKQVLEILLINVINSSQDDDGITIVYDNSTSSLDDPAIKPVTQAAFSVCIFTRETAIPVKEQMNAFDWVELSDAIKDMPGVSVLEMSICEHIVLRHGGVIKVDRKTNGRIAFAFIIPIPEPDGSNG